MTAKSGWRRRLNRTRRFCKSTDTSCNGFDAVAAGLHLVNEVADGQRVVLGGAEDERLLALNDLLHEEFHAVRLALPDLDDPVEVGFRVAHAGFNFAFDQLV